MIAWNNDYLMFEPFITHIIIGLGFVFLIGVDTTSFLIQSEYIYHVFPSECGSASTVDVIRFTNLTQLGTRELF